MKVAMPFEWHPDEPPPQIEEHSKAKLQVLRSYLRAYCDRLNIIPNRDEFKLDLVDGFAGGGTFLDDGDLLSGTPLVMLEEASSAAERLNRKRNKPLHVDCKFYFVDKEVAHTDHLRKILAERGHEIDQDRVVVRTGPFENEIEGILQSIHCRQPRAGRAIFLLDQTGYSQVEMALVSRIFAELPAAEVILTFAADTLVNHLSETTQIAKAGAPLQLSESQIEDLIHLRDGKGGRALVQRLLRNHARAATGATYDTPFFIRPGQSRRALWFLHLSRHPTARDVMLQRHWDIQNTFEHYGPGDFGMLGWDALKDSKTVPLFNFVQIDLEQMDAQLLESLPRELYSLASEQPVTVNAMRHAIANRTAARFSDLDRIVLQLMREREVDILNPAGKRRSRSLTRLNPTDRISLPRNLLLPGISSP